VFRSASRSNPAPAARQVRRVILVSVSQRKIQRRECAGLARATLELLEEGDVSGARALLAKVLTPNRGRRSPWGVGWVERLRSRRLTQPWERTRNPAQAPHAVRAAPGSGATAVLVQSAPIRIEALGGFDLTIDGITFASGAKPQRRPLDLLKILLISNGSSIGAAELADKLWPDSEGDTARNALQVAVHRLRRLLGRDQAIVVQDRKVSLDHELCTVDLWTFERDATHLVCAYPEASSFAEKAAETLHLYRGHLFAHEADQAWMLAPRERLRRLWLGLVRRLGDCHELRGQCDRACELYQRAVDLDPLAEEVYRRLMRCQQSAGECAEAAHTYRRCREQLVTVLGVGPSAETERLYHTLRSAA